MATPNIIKWGFIGCGEATERRALPAFAELENSEVVAVMSRTPARARAFAERHGIERWYSDAQNLVTDPDVDAVYIATPPSTHSTYAVMALMAGKAVYVEKPLAINYDECLRINRVAAAQQRACFVAYYRRYLPYFQRVKELIESGTIGRVLTAQIRFAAPPREMDSSKTDLPWRLQPDIAGGGYFYDLAPHQIDIMQQLFGPIVEATGFPANRGGLYKAEDTVAATMRFHNGMPASGTWCFVAHESAREDRILVIGDKGQLSFSVFTYAPIHIQNEQGEEHVVVENPQNVQYPLLRNIVDHLQGRDVCTCDSVSATSTNWVIDRILGKL
ncbi:MAG: Gfo/Idh/MocA family oxidoreductase [Bacteroidales bacterium]|nr:Gfo/Idh/MocA family oxidoreductase [Bacteroidales bacterium]